jgi:polysaccharide biosynthesis/export protein
MSGCAMLRIPLGHARISDPPVASGRAGTPLGAGYELQPGDVLTVSVWKDADLTGDVLIRPDGGITLPLVGDIEAAGHTVEQIRAEINRRLGKFVPDPVVTVTVKEALGDLIFVIGKVNRPGQFPIERRIDVMQALSLAGGMTPFAAGNEIQILRRQNGKQIAIPFHYRQVEHGRDLEQNILLRAGDTVVVP